MILLNPGPVNLTARVRDALLGPDSLPSRAGIYRFAE